MKLYHFALIFIVFFVVTVIHTDIAIGTMKEIETEQTRLTKMLESATSDAIDYLASTEVYGEGKINKNEVVETFFTSLYSSIGIMSDMIAQRELDLYIPVIVLCDSDGFYLYYYDEYKDGYGNSMVDRMWSEKMPYYSEDELFIYRFTLTDLIYIYDKKGSLGDAKQTVEVYISDLREKDIYKDFRHSYPNHYLLQDDSYEFYRKNILMDQLEERISHFVNVHNFIARRNGIFYEFAFTDSSLDWGAHLDDVNIIVVFQGYPYGNSRNYTLNKVASAGANIIRKPTYYVEEKSWYKLAHRKGCEELINNAFVLEETYNTIESFVAIGAYSHECIDHGSRVPVLK